MVGGSSRAKNAPRKEKSTPTKAITSIQSAAPTESIPRPSASSITRSLGGLKISIRRSDRGPDVSGSVSPIEVSLDIEDKRKGVGDYRVIRSLLKSIILPTDVQTFEKLVHHMDHFVEVIREVRHLSKEAEEKAVQANRRADDAQLSRLKVEDETKSLRERVKQLESELAKAEARVLRERDAEKAWVEAAKVEVVEAFRALEKFCNIKMNFASLYYLQGGIDLKEKVQRIFLDLNLDLLESDDEEAEEVEGRKVQIEDIFSPMRDDPTIEDVASIPPTIIIILPD
ncbi:hypothetical protein COCNU_14G002020 [Cocos nucifera]|uniref:Uncharacterized protein n=1 Tax=Cocos nucifera TaxID=13894 RepID=A0A8K0NBR3_COCNU|nr:hypothetical protein COCNU_14G002020 [Cocos nucifera]